jgi:ABC-type molybdate transport system substrate-binding protein
MITIRSVLFAVAASLAISAQAQTTLPFFAADSLRPALDEVAAAYTSARVEVQYGSSTALRDRIAAGERPALFASSNVDYPNSLTLQGLAGPVKRFARDRHAELGVVLIDGSSEEAWYFVQFILSPEGQAILAKHGFSRGGSALAAANSN